MGFIDVLRGPEKKPQTFANHVRFVPMYHFVTLLIGLISVVLSILISFGIIAVTFLAQITPVLIALVAFFGAFYARLFALRAQDRIIRLEETLRLQRLLPDDLKGRIGDLSADQLVALRFASDAELADLVKQTLAENLTNSQIKGRIKDWRPDYLRV